MANNYYCLVSGLPEIFISDTKKPFDLEVFREELQEALFPEDYELIKLYFYRYDNQNVINLLNNNTGNINPLGMFSKEQLEEEIQSIKVERGVTNGPLPEYLQMFIAESFTDNPENPALSPENQLAQAYYMAASNNKNIFIRNFFLFELNTLNFLAATISRKYNLGYENEVLGDDDISLQIRKSTARDFNLLKDFDYTTALLQMSDLTDIKDREKKLDMLKWEYVDEAVFFNYFTIERIFAYVVKLDIFERWQSLTAKEGKASFNNLLQGLRSGFKMPEEYVKK